MRKKVKKITYDSSNVATPNAKRAYAGSKVRKQKVVIVETPRKIKKKVVDYGPVNYYGKQKKTKTITVIRKK